MVIMDAIQFGTVITADLHENTLTFEMDEAICICAGEYAIIKIDNIVQKQALEEFLTNSK